MSYMCYKAEFLQLELKNPTSVLDLETGSEQFPINLLMQHSDLCTYMLGSAVQSIKI